MLTVCVLTLGLSYENVTTEKFSDLLKIPKILNVVPIANVLPMSRPVVTYGCEVDNEIFHLGKALLVYNTPNKILPALTMLLSASSLRSYNPTGTFLSD